MQKPILITIADILNSDTDNAILKAQLKSTEMDWDNLVKIGSEHLLLPAIYCNLRRKNLLRFLPKDLTMYLEEITELNDARNTELLQEIQELSNLLDTQYINHIFIKGAALIAGGFYVETAERMVGDIDILIDQNHIEDAFNLLIEQGYSRQLKFNYDNPSFRHLPRLISESKLGAVELHSNIINHSKSRAIDNSKLFLDKVKRYGIWMPCKSHLSAILIYAQQINSNGFALNTVNLKYLNDVFNIDSPLESLLISKKKRDKYIDSFKLYMNTLFYSKKKLNHGFLIKKLRLKIQLYHPRLHRHLLKFRLFWLAIEKRIGLFINNSNYRLNIVNNLIFRKKNTI